LSFEKRASPVGLAPADALVGGSAAFAPFVAQNGTLPAGGILARYQLLTPGIIMALLVAFFVLVPITFMAISAVASIQAPKNMAAPKGYSADTKKTQ
jgi:hypothetical protein